MGTATIRSQIERAETFLVPGATERHPAGWPSWGRALKKRERPLFRAALIATAHSNANGLSPIFRDHGVTG